MKILSIGTDRSEQTVRTKIRLLLKEQSDQGQHCFPFHPHFLALLLHCKPKLFLFKTVMVKISGVPSSRIIIVFIFQENACPVWELE